METDYKTKRKLTRRDMLGFCVLGGGATIVLGGLGYGAFKSPSIYPSLRRQYEINRELDRGLNVSLGDLESESSELIARANELKNEIYEMTSDPNFAEIKERYKSERKKVDKRFNYSLLLGWGTIAVSYAILSPFSKKRQGYDSGIQEDSSTNLKKTPTFGDTNFKE